MADLENDKRVFFIQFTEIELCELIEKATAKSIEQALGLISANRTEEISALMTEKEVLKYLRISHVGLYNLKKRNEINYVRIGKSIRFRREDVLEFVNRKKR